MIKKGLFITAFIFGLASFLEAQPAPDSDVSKITMHDLQPSVNYSDSDPFYQPIREKEGYALLSSAIIPGSGQAANGKWIRAGAYFLAEVAFIGLHIKNYHDAKAEQRRYKRFANNNWSVVSYANWLVDYHEQNQLSNPHIDDLESKLSGASASYNHEADWDKVDIELLRDVERNTPFVFPDKTGNTFSHVMPDYGSQQYYELISKYYQFGSGWNDFGQNKNGESVNNTYQLNWDGSDMPFNFYRGSRLAEQFNDSFRFAGNMVSLLILNHIVSAFDAFLSVKIKNNRLKTETNFLDPQQTISFKYHF